MLAGMSLGTELKRYSKGIMPRIAIITIVLLPLLYGAMYLWVFWNPFDAVNKLPVALVNEDRGAMVQGQELKAGDEVVANLKSSGELDVVTTDAADAADGLAHGRYYFTITLPSDFSAAIGSATGPDPRKAVVNFTFNDANNYLASVIGNSAAAEVMAALNEKIGQQSVDQVLVGLQTAGVGLEKAADGSKQLADGLDQANSGAQQLAAGTKELASNMGTARDGAEQLAAGNATLADGIVAATDPLMPLLNDVQSLNVSAQTAEEVGALTGQLSEVLGVVSATGQQQSQAAQAVQQTIKSLRQRGDPGAVALANALKPVLDFLTTQGVTPSTTKKLDQLSTQADKLSQQLANPNSPMRAMLVQLNLGELAGKVTELRSGAEQLKTGSATLADGLVQLDAGSQQLAAGASQLAEGTPQLSSGADELASGLSGGLKQLPNFGDATRRQMVAGNLAEPVELKTITHNPAPTFGSGFAPFFLTLAMFIGTLIIWMLIAPLQSRAVIGGVSGLRAVLWSYWPAALIAGAQVLVMFIVAHFGVGLSAVHAWGMLGFMALIAAAFLAVLQMFNILLGPAVGRVVSLAFLMVQIVASGGIYPVPTTAKPAQILHPWDPMSYAVTGLRQVISGGIDDRMWTSVAVLGGLLVGSLLISSWGARRNRQYTMEQLYPPIEV